jgi:hypothetical protein
MSSFSSAQKYAQLRRTANHTDEMEEAYHKQETFNLTLSIMGLSGATMAAYAIDTIYSGGTGLGVLILYPAALCMITRISPTFLSFKQAYASKPRVIRVASSVPV